MISIILWRLLALPSASSFLFQELCASTSWVTTTTVICSAQVQGAGPDGHGNVYGEFRSDMGTLWVQLESQHTTQTGASTFSFDAPIVSRLYRQNAPSTVKLMLTITGLNFGSIYFSPTGLITPNACTTLSWSSSTSLHCKFETPYSGHKKNSVVTLSSNVGTLLHVFSFNAPAVSFLDRHNMGGTTGWLLTFRGIDFGGVPLTQTSRIGMTTCATATLDSSTSLQCIVEAMSAG